MDEQSIKKLKDIATTIRKTSGKIKLISLLCKAKEEYEQCKFEDCMKSCKKVLKTEPDNPIALRGLGCVMQSMGNNKKALEYYHKALDYSEHKEIEYTLIGTIYYQEENLDEAIKYYNLAIEANDDYDKAYEGRNQSMLENHLKIIDLQDNLIQRNLF